MTNQDCYQKYENRIGTFFGKYGALVSNYPIWILTICICFNCLLGIGLIRIEFETDAETLYTPMNSKAFEDQATIKKVFGDFSGTNFFIKSLSDLGSYGEVIIQSKNGENILVTKYFNDIKDIHDSILTNVTFTDNMVTYTYYDVCALRNNTCVVTGEILLTPYFQQMALRQNVTYPMFGTEFISPMCGNVVISNGLLTSATMIKLRYNLKQNTTRNQNLSRKWETAFITYMKSLQRNLTNLAYASEDSLRSELDKNTESAIIYFSFTFILMILYASIVTIGGDCVSDRSHIGRAGVMATILAILGSFGLVSACGIKFANIVGVVPFLIIGIGLDDMFILMSGLADNAHLESIHEKIKQTMMSSGVAITITSITDFLAFGIGASSPFLSVRNFCIYTGVAVVFCYLNQLTFTMPCLVIHERRSSQRKSCATCRQIRPRQELKAENRSSCYVFCCGGTQARKRSDTENPMEKYPIIVIKKLVLFTPIKVLILILFSAYLGVSVWGTINLEQGLDLSNLVPDDSYYRTYSEIERDHFTTEILVSFVISSEYQYSASSTQITISDVLSRVTSNSDMRPSFEINWLSSFKNSDLYDESSEKNFISNLKRFLSYRSDLENDVVFDETHTKITASRFYAISNNLKNSTSQGNLMLNLRDIAYSSGISSFVYAPSFIYFEQYVQILPNTLQTLGIAVGSMLLVTTMFMPHPFIIAFVTLTLVMICVGIFGFMHFWGLTLSSVTMIQIIMSVGFSVDFSAHICHAFLIVKGTDRNAKVAAAITRSGGPILNAAVSSIVGILVMLVPKSYIFRSFFKLMFLVIVFGLGHSIFLLPVLLSLLGPMPRNKTDDLAQTEFTSKNCTLHNDQLTDGSKEVKEGKLNGNLNENVDKHEPKKLGCRNPIFVSDNSWNAGNYLNRNKFNHVSLPKVSGMTVIYDRHGYRTLDPTSVYELHRRTLTEDKDNYAFSNMNLQYNSRNLYPGDITLTPTWMYNKEGYTELSE